jgi:hypothetical protein
LLESDITVVDTSNIILPERWHFYRWTVDYNQYLRRGRALVFSQSKEDDSTGKMLEKLRMLEYDPEWKPLATMDATLESSESKFADICVNIDRGVQFPRMEFWDSKAPSSSSPSGRSSTSNFKILTNGSLQSGNWPSTREMQLSQSVA